MLTSSGKFRQLLLTVAINIHSFAQCEPDQQTSPKMNSPGMVEVLVCCLSLYTEYLGCEAHDQAVYQPSMVSA